MCETDPRSRYGELRAFGSAHAGLARRSPPREASDGRDVAAKVDPVRDFVDDATALERMAAVAARARAATDRDVLWAGQASRRATGGRSAIGTVARSSRSGLVSTRGSTATLRPRAIRCISSL